jgi:hypothetical protein
MVLPYLVGGGSVFALETLADGVLVLLRRANLGLVGRLLPRGFYPGFDVLPPQIAATWWWFYWWFYWWFRGTWFTPSRNLVHPPTAFTFRGGTAFSG